MSESTAPVNDDPLQPGGSDPYAGRAICDAVRLFDLCPRKPCQRAGACRGAPLACIRRNAKRVPREVWDWVGAILEARDDGLSDEEFADAIEPHLGAIVCWVVGLQVGRAAARRTSGARAAR